jgi:hypothetical protein
VPSLRGVSSVMQPTAAMIPENIGKINQMDAGRGIILSRCATHEAAGIQRPAAEKLLAQTSATDRREFEPEWKRHLGATGPDRKALLVYARHHEDVAGAQDIRRFLLDLVAGRILELVINPALALVLGYGNELFAILLAIDVSNIQHALANQLGIQRVRQTHSVNAINYGVKLTLNKIRVLGVNFGDQFILAIRGGISNGLIGHRYGFFLRRTSSEGDCGYEKAGTQKHRSYFFHGESFAKNGEVNREAAAISIRVACMQVNQ